jgi:hypothetical protein
LSPPQQRQTKTGPNAVSAAGLNDLIDFIDDVWMESIDPHEAIVTGFGNDALWDVGARIAPSAASGQFEFALYGKNLTDHRVDAGVQIDPNTQTRFATAPYHHPANRVVNRRNQKRAFHLVLTNEGKGCAHAAAEHDISCVQWQNYPRPSLDETPPPNHMNSR